MGIPSKSLPKHLRLRLAPPDTFFGRVSFLLKCTVPTVGLHCKTRNHHDLPALRAAKALYATIIPKPPAPLAPPYLVKLHFALPRFKYKPDLENMSKVLVDCLVRAGWLVDDAYVREIELSKCREFYTGDGKKILGGVAVEMSTLQTVAERRLVDPQFHLEHYQGVN
jgi:Holliday junction resolvase RusA-like endonuclease